MALKSTFTPKASLTEAPTNLKEAIDWVLRVTGKDGKGLNKDKGECICGLAAAVTDLLQSVELEYHGYQGESNGADNSQNKGATEQQVKEHLNELFSLVQGLGGTAVVRTYIDQLAQVLSALVGWSKIDKCWKGGSQCKKGNKEHHGQSGSGCEYLKDIKPDNKCQDCGCMKWVVIKDIDWVQLGRGCTRCKGSGSEEEKKKQECKCGTNGCSTGKECQCAKDGRCCKCYCKDTCGCKKDAKCSCVKEEKKNGTSDLERRIYKDTYQSAYGEMNFISIYDGSDYRIRSTWTDLLERGGSKTPSQRRHQCARILLGSVCLIWSGITYMYWTGKWAKTSPYWNNHILDGSGLDDGTLSQWLQALGFPRNMLNGHGPKNRLDQVIWNGHRDMFFLGFVEPSGLGDDVKDENGNTARAPFGMNYPGFVHTIHRDSFNTDATVFPKDGTGSGTTGQINDTDQNKNGAIFKLYILSCAYFTGLQRTNAEKATANTNSTTPRTIREILYWLSALPYSPAYKEMLDYAKGRLQEVLKKPGETESSSAKETELKFHQTGRNAPITVHEYNLFAHFQAVTQYCPLVLIGIQGGLKGTDSTNSTKEPAIHSLYANTQYHFTYPTVPIQAYNQVVHYIRALFYQLYFLRKQCAIKVTCGGKWRECRYGKDVVSKGVISWMCLGCDPMEHDRKCRVEKVKGEILKGVKDEKAEKGEESEDGEEDEEGQNGNSKTLPMALRELLEAIGNVVVQLGNAQEALEGKEKEAIEEVKRALEKAKAGLESAKAKFKNDVSDELEFELEDEDEGTKALKKLINKDGNAGLLGELTNGGSGALDTLVGGGGAGSLQQITSENEEWKKDYSSAKDKISDVIHKVRDVLKLLKKGLPEVNDQLNDHEGELLKAIKKIVDVIGDPNCPSCKDHSTKCGRQGENKTCPTCHQQYMDGTPSPLQAFLEDRLPGFSCTEVLNQDNDTPNYPPAASHLEHCGGSGQCCPLPMGFRGQFQEGITHTGQRLYGILYFFSNENMMQSCVYTLVRVTAELSATTPQVLGDVFGFFRGGIGEKESGRTKKDTDATCKHDKDPSNKGDEDYFCGWCASGLREEVKGIQWIDAIGTEYRTTVGTALINIKGEKGSDTIPLSDTQSNTTSLSRLTENCQYLSPLTGELYTAVSATFGGTYLSWVLYLSDALHSGLESLSDAFRNVECRGCKGQCDPNKCKKGMHGKDSGLCGCQSIVSCTGVLPVLYRHGFSYGNPFNLEGYTQKDGKTDGQYDIEDKRKDSTKQCHQFLDSLSAVIDKNKQDTSKAASQNHPLTELLKQVGQLQYDIRLPWIFVLTLAWLVAVLYLAFGAIWPLDWTHMRSHWLPGGEHQWQCMWYKVMTGRKGVDLMEYFGWR